MRELTLRDLADAVGSRRGKVTAIGSNGSLLDRAKALRELAWREADRVVLPVHMWDPIPAIAFGIEGGPPVFVLKHADHAFWVCPRLL
jgi:hypothetical protein